MSRILVVDDEQSICWGFSKLGQTMGHEVVTVASAEEGLRVAIQSPPDLLILDIRLPGIDGLTAMGQYRSVIGDTPIVVITAFGDLETAVQAVQNGAFEYVIKPFDLDAIRTVVERGLREHRVAPLVSHGEAADHMIGRSPELQAVFKHIALAAASDANVILQGESGVGKDLAARAIHQHSNRSGSHFVAVNLAALSPNLAESELFGHVDGAFTGAKDSREGLLVKADGGTLFLDEVADIPLPLQIKLLRAIEEGEVFPVGADKPVTTHFRVVSATHQDLQKQVRSGTFRHDLFFRICAFEIKIPALRERADDIPLLASYFASRFGNGKVSLAAETVEEMKRRTWYGNIRELRNAVEHARVIARSGVVLPEHLPPPQTCLSKLRSCPDHQPSLAEVSHRRAKELLDDPDAIGSVYSRYLREVEGPLLETAMQQFDNECAPAARALGLHRTTLKKKLVEHNLCEAQSKE